MGELSSARLALEGEAVAPGDQATLDSSQAGSTFHVEQRVVLAQFEEVQERCGGRFFWDHQRPLVSVDAQSAGPRVVV